MHFGTYQDCNESNTKIGITFVHELLKLHTLYSNVFSIQRYHSIQSPSKVVHHHCTQPLNPFLTTFSFSVDLYGLSSVLVSPSLNFFICLHCYCQQCHLHKLQPSVDVRQLVKNSVQHVASAWSLLFICNEEKDSETAIQRKGFYTNVSNFNHLCQLIKVMPTFALLLVQPS